MYVYVSYIHQALAIAPSSHEVKITVAMGMCTVLDLYLVVLYVLCCIYVCIWYEHLHVCTDCVYVSMLAEISAIHLITDTKCTRHSIVPCSFSIAPL